MTRTGLVRASLWLTFPFNLAAAGIFAFPASTPGRLLGLAADVDPVYVALSAFMVALFGCCYAWLALQPDPHQPLLCVGAIGKAGVFLIALNLWLSNAASGSLVLLASGDLLLATFWFWSLAASRQTKST